MAQQNPAQPCAEQQKHQHAPDLDQQLRTLLTPQSTPAFQLRCQGHWLALSLRRRLLRHRSHLARAIS